MDDQASKSSTGALRPERARPTAFACPNIGINMIAMAAATVVQRLAGGTPHSTLRRPDCTQILHHNGTRPPRRLPLKPVFLNCPRRRHGSCKAASIVLQTSPG